MNVAHWEDENLRRFGDYEAVVCDGRSWTLASLRHASCRLARGLSQMGLRPGDRVLLLLPNCAELLIASSAIWRVGGVVVLAFAGSPAAEIERIVEHCAPTAIVTAPGTALDHDLAKRVGVRWIAIGDGAPAEALAWEGLIARHEPLEELVARGPTDPVQILYTSGTTGTPKAVLYTGRSMEALLDWRRRKDGELASVQVVVLPPAGFAARAMRERTGSKQKLVLLDKFDPVATLEAIQRHRATRIAMVPSMCEAILAHPRFSAFDCASLEEIMVGGASVSPSLASRLEDAFRRRPSIAYGMTELGGPLTSSYGLGKPGSVGPPLDGSEMRIVDDAGRDRPSRGVGHLYARTPWMADSYFLAPEETGAVFRDGWVKTGDLAYLDEDGELYLVGRSKDVVIQSGVNVYPHEVVEVIERVSGVVECAAFGVPNAFLGEELVACVAARSDAGITEQKILDHCRNEMDPRKVPVHVAVFESLPKNSVGKIHVAELRDQIIARRSPPSGNDLLLRLRGASPSQRVELVAEVLERELVRLGSAAGAGLDAAFGERGLSSLDAVRYAHALSDMFGLAVLPTFAFDFPTPRRQIDFLLRRLDLLDSEIGHSESAPRDDDEPIAIVGMACRFPGNANDPEALWSLLRDGVDAVTEVPRERWDVDAVFDPDPDAKGKSYGRWGGFLADVDRFDAEFFGISPREASSLDPQHRLLLETTWEALEAAGQPPSDLDGSATGVFMGLMSHDYESLVGADLRRLDGYVRTGSSSSIAAGRISYILGLRGPSLTIDTACSSSLVAVHLACQSLRRGECDLALAGGASLVLTPAAHVEFSRLRGLARDGRCRTFDAAADGTTWSEGCGVIVLERLSTAKARGDRVLALVRSSFVNHDGRSNGLTAPNGVSQEALLRRTLALGHLGPSDVDYVEAHGTGTTLGDPVEVGALGAALGQGRPAHVPLLVGSLKTNFGHMQAAAGVAGIMKVVLSLTHESIPPTLHFQTPNPHVPWSDLNVAVVAKTTDWKPSESGRPRIAGVSGFGIGGTNAHVVLQEAEPSVPLAPAPVRSAELVLLSAKSAAALHAGAGKLRAHLAVHPELALGDVAFSSATTRSHHEHRVALAVESREALDHALAVVERGETPPGACEGSVIVDSPKVVFVFPGQGSQWTGMCRELLASEPEFREAILACDRAIEAEASWSLMAELHADENRLRPDRIDIVQPVLFAVAVGLAALWRSWGIEPDVVVGHSMGEAAAAVVSGALSLEDGVAIMCRRSALLRRISGNGAMALVELPLADAEAIIAEHGGGLSVAVTNTARASVLSGGFDAVTRVLRVLEARGVFCRRVNVDYGSHSAEVDDLRDDLLVAIAGLSPQRATVPMRSTVTGARLDGPELVASYWADNLRQRVRFAEVIQDLLAEGPKLFVEMSPHPLLLPSIEELQRESGGSGVAVGSLRRDQPERRALLESVGALYVHGRAPDWKRLFPSGGRRVDLPTYAWQRTRCWVDPAVARRIHGDDGGHPLLGRSTTLSSERGTQLWESSIDIGRLPWLSDHQLQGAMVFPAAAYLEMALAAGAEVFDGGRLAVGEVVLSQAFVIPDDGAATLQTVARAAGDGRLTLTLASRTGDERTETWTEHVRATVRRVESPGAPSLDVGAARAHLGAPIGRDATYDLLERMGFEYGPAFRGVVELWSAARESLGRIALPTAAGARTGYHVHPALLDACFHVVAGAMPGDEASWVPVEVGALRVHRGGLEGELWCHVRVTDASEERRRCDLRIADAAGATVIEIDALVLQRLSTSGRDADRGTSPEDAFLRIEWEEAAVPAARSGNGRWLVIGDGRGLGAELRGALETMGHRVAHVSGAMLDDRSVDGVRALLARIPDVLRGPPTAVVHLRSLDGEEEERKDIEHALVVGCDSALHFVQALTKTGWRDAPRLWLVTRGAQALGTGGTIDVTQAPLLGLARVIAFEHGDLRCARLDLDPAWPGGEAARVAAELVGDSDEDEVAFRHGARHVARIARASAAGSVQNERVVPAAGRSFRLELDAPGLLDRLVLRTRAPRSPEKGEVQIAVEAAGLNFLDVLVGLGALPGDGRAREALGFGGECSGRVVAVGDGVEDVTPGDAVMALSTGAIASHVTTSSVLVLRRPRALSAEQAASLPVAMLTAWYALDKVARLRRGERVLVHAATGGVGLAAVQWAQHVGAEIFATAGTPEKRALLASLGVQHVSDSRSADFARDIRMWTRGEGVDVVLNSLSGDRIDESLGLLRSFGRFVELGKRDYQANHLLGLRPFLKGLSFSLVDLRAMMLERPGFVRELLDELVTHVEAGTLRPLPVEAVPISRAPDAFRKMAQARHVGKIVLTLNDPDARVHVPATASDVTFRADASYLVTGGLGGLGLSLASWLVDRGARHVVLMGRSEMHRPDQRAAVESLERAGARVTIARADVSDREEVRRVLDGMASSGFPLRGVFHAAGVLDDGLLVRQSPRRLRTVMAPKIQGAWNLHELTRSHDLDLFVMYGSAAGLLGSPGQGNYAAANAFLDALAWHRRSLGLPALTIDWGAFSEVGLVAAEGHRETRLEHRGARALSPEQGLDALARLLVGDVTQMGVVPLDVRQWVEFFPSAASSRLLSRLVADQRTMGRPAGEKELLRELASAPPEARVARLEAFLRAQVSHVLRVAPEKLDVAAPLKSLGLDSLTGLELRNRIEAGLAVRVPATLVWKYPTIRALALHFADVGDPPPKPPRKDELDAGPKDAVPELRSMTSEDRDAAIAARLARLSRLVDDIEG